MLYLAYIVFDILTYDPTWHFLSYHSFVSFDILFGGQV